MTLGDVIKEFRASHNMSMDEFAKISDISKAYISVLEKNKRPKSGKSINPTLEMYKKVAAGMGITLEQLFNMVDPDSSISLAQEPDIEIDEKHPLLKLFESMNPQGQQMLLEYARYIADTPKYKKDYLASPEDVG